VEKKNSEITGLILEQLDKGSEMIEYIKDRPGHDLRYALNARKLEKLGWQTEFDFERAIKETVRWYKQNDWWWRPLKSGEYLEYYKKQYKIAL